MAELASKLWQSRDQAAGDPFEGMSPVDALRMRQELASRYPVSSEQASQNRRTTAMDALSVLPVVGNAMSGYDATQSAGDAYGAFGRGDIKGGALATALTALNGVGAVAGLPFGRSAGKVAKQAKNIVFSGAGPVNRNVKLYHGTNAAFDNFEQDYLDDVGAVWMADDPSYVRSYLMNYRTGPNSRIISAEPNIKNEYVFDIMEEAKKDAEYIGIDPSKITPDEAQEILSGGDWDGLVARLVREARDGGHDALRIANFTDSTTKHPVNAYLIWDLDNLNRSNLSSEPYSTIKSNFWGNTSGHSSD